MFYAAVCADESCFAVLTGQEERNSGGVYMRYMIVVTKRRSEAGIIEAVSRAMGCSSARFWGEPSQERAADCQARRHRGSHTCHSLPIAFHAHSLALLPMVLPSLTINQRHLYFPSCYTL